MYIYDNSSLNSHYDVKHFRKKYVMKTKHTFYVQNFLPKIVPFMK
jgi:hypothetical protein